MTAPRTRTVRPHPARPRTITETAAILGLDRATVRAFVAAGDLDAITSPSGHRRWVTWASIARLMGITEGTP